MSIGAGYPLGVALEHWSIEAGYPLGIALEHVGQVLCLIA